MGLSATRTGLTITDAGLPTGGTTGQALVKASNEDYDVKWATGSGGGGVSSLNTLTGAVTLVAGTNITLTPVGNNITIDASGGGSPGGATTQIQFNNAGSFDGDADLTWDDTNKIISVPEVMLKEALGAEMVVNGSFSAPTKLIVTTANVSISPDQITISPDPGWVPGDVIQYGAGGGAVIGSLEDGDSFWVRTNTAGVITFSSTVAGAAFNMTGTGNNAQFFCKTDWFAGTSGVTGAVPGWQCYDGPAKKQVAGVSSLTPAVALVPTPGQTYKIVYTVANWTVAGCTVVFGGVTAQPNTAPNANGTYTVYVTAQTNATLLFTALTGMRADITFVSVKPVLSMVTASAGLPMVFNNTLSNPLTNENAFEFNYTTNKATDGDTVGLLINSTETSAPGTDSLIRGVMGGTQRFNISNAGAYTSASSMTITGALSGVTTYSASAQQVYTSSAGASLAVSLYNAALFTGGTGTTNFPQIFSQPTGTTAVTTWNTGGTVFGANLASGSTANFLDLHVAGGASLFKVDQTGSITLADVANIVVGSTTGTKIGTATSQKLSLWNATPVIQPASANQTAITDSTGGSTANTTIVDVGVVFSQANINDNFAKVTKLLNQLRSDLVTIGAIKGAA